ncbi:hypothetical protein E2P81_ATG03849 [Venturia nashicola]|nr:hypothetical protein E2P81_ATG03849 [Venturia nashicola]
MSSHLRWCSQFLAISILRVTLASRTTEPPARPKLFNARHLHQPHTAHSLRRHSSTSSTHIDAELSTISSTTLDSWPTLAKLTSFGTHTVATLQFPPALITYPCLRMSLPLFSYHPSHYSSQ